NTKSIENNMDIKSVENAKYYSQEDELDDDQLTQKSEGNESTILNKNSRKLLSFLMEPLEKATKLLSTSSYLTIADVQFLFSGIQDYLEDYVENSESELGSGTNQDSTDELERYLALS
ncbi:6066_t:CDS:2, partial [Dentiscutata heterogama]